MAAFKVLACLNIVLFYCLPFLHGDDRVSCLKGSTCIPLLQCNFADADILIYPCHAGLNLVCCPKELNQQNSTSLANRKTAQFPVNCGTVLTANKISAGKTADYGQFPWMALLGYRQRRVEFTQFLCGGTVITEQYVLTAAHCINLDRRLELSVVRLGEHNIATEKDCFKIDKDEFCADPPVNILIARTLIHPKYDNQKFQNDIALVNVKQKIPFTDYIQPICLPFERALETLNLAKQKFIVSGWGKIQARNVAGANELQFASVTVWDHGVCSKTVPPNVKPITDSQLCANGPSKEDACRGDSGGPLVNATRDIDGEIRFFQIGVVSFASTVTCGDPSLPTVYTRLDKYLKWIEENVL